MTATLLPELFANPPTPGQTTPWVLATLTAAITTTPAAGTVESWAVSASAPAQLQGLVGQFRVVIDSEVMIVTATPTGASPWSFTRGAEGSTVATHASGTSISHVITEGGLKNIALQALFSGGLPGVAYTARFDTSAGGTLAPPYQVAYAQPILLRAGTLSSILARHYSTTSAGEVLRMGIYADTGQGYPGALLVDAGTIDLSTAAGVKSISLTNTIPHGGLYWIASVPQGTSTSAVMLTYGSDANSWPGISMPTSPSDLQTRTFGYSSPGIAGALPATFPGGGSAVNNVASFPIIGVEY